MVAKVAASAVRWVWQGRPVGLQLSPGVYSSQPLSVLIRHLPALIVNRLLHVQHY